MTLSQRPAGLVSANHDKAGAIYAESGRTLRRPKTDTHLTQAELLQVPELSKKMLCPAAFVSVVWVDGNVLGAGIVVIRRENG